MPSRPKAGIPVRGSCPAGHVTERISDPGRTTAEGECSHDGCDERVRMKRIPKDRTPPPPAPGDEGDATRVVRVDSYDGTGSGAQDDAGGLGVIDADPAELEHGAGGDDSADPGSPPDPIGEDGGTFLDRLAARRRARRSAGRRTYSHPLIG